MFCLGVCLFAIEEILGLKDPGVMLIGLHYDDETGIICSQVARKGETKRALEDVENGIKVATRGIFIIRSIDPFQFTKYGTLGTISIDVTLKPEEDDDQRLPF